MHSSGRHAGPRAWRNALAIVLLLEVPLALAVACSSTPANPPELASQDTGIPDRFEAAQPEPEEKPEPMPEPVPEAGPDVLEAEAEASCIPLNDGGAGATVTPTSLLFGDGGQVGCGTQAQPLTLTVVNETCTPFTFTSTVTSGTNYYTVTPAQGLVPALGSQTVTVNPTPIPQISAVTPDLYEGTLNITTTAPGDSGHIVQLHMTAYGAILASTEFGETLSFGGVAIGQQASNQFSVTNTGNASTTLKLAVGSQYFGVGTADGGAPSFPIASNQSVAPLVTFSPTAVQPYTDTISTTVLAGTPLCAAPPATIQLTGQGTTGVAVSPTNLPFGLVQCGQPAAPYQTITITNTGAAITYTPTFLLGANSPYTLADNGGNPITAGVPIALGAASSVTIRVVPKQIPNPATTANDGYADTLTITTTGPGDSPHNIALHETAQGTIFTLAPTSIATSAGPGLSTFVNFQVGNAGNLTASYTLTAATTKGPADTFTSNLTGGNLGGNSTENGILTCIGDPSDAAVQDLGTLTLTPGTGTILCADPPPPMPLSVTN
jgi:hypothetical protein